MKILVVLILLGVFGVFHIKKTHGIGPGEWISQQVKSILSSRTGIQSQVSREEAIVFFPLLLPPRPVVKEMLRFGALPVECQVWSERIFDLDLNGYDQKGSPNFLFVKDIPRPPVGCNLDSPAVKWVMGHFHKSCFASNPSQFNPPDFPCVKSIILLRATLTKTVLMTDPNRLTKAGKEELTDLVYASVELSAGMGEAPAFGEVREVSEKLNEKLPGVRLLQKALFVARINLWKVYKDTMTYPEQSRFWEENKALLERGRILGLPEKDLKSMEFALETRGFEPALVKKHADQLKGSAESEARKAFLTAFQMWRQAEAGTAMEQIRNAIQLAPNDPVYPEVFRELSVPGAGEEVFLKVLNVDLSPADFENL